MVVLLLPSEACRPCASGSPKEWLQQRIEWCYFHCTLVQSERNSLPLVNVTDVFHRLMATQDSLQDEKVNSVLALCAFVICS